MDLSKERLDEYYQTFLDYIILIAAIPGLVGFLFVYTDFYPEYGVILIVIAAVIYGVFHDKNEEEET